MTDGTDDSKMYYLLGKNYQRWVCKDKDYYAFITPDIIITKIIELTKEHLQGLSHKVIWDMFAGIGCDGIRMGKHAGKVICTELQPQTCDDLKQNVENMGMCNVEVLNADCCKCVDKIMCNIVYFDPPWGETFRSGLPFDFKDVILDDGTPVLELAKSVSVSHDMIIKSPISSDSFEMLFGDRVTEIFTFTQQKLKFMVVKANKEIEY